MSATTAAGASEIWNKLASWWDKDIGASGDEFHKELIFPYMKHFVDLKKGDIVLDIGCGNGSLIRFLYQHGVIFHGVDYSSVFVEAAKKHSTDFPSILYRQCDATDPQDLHSLDLWKDRNLKYDVIICSMVLHDIATITPLFDALTLLLNEHGKFIIAIPSPHFNSVYNTTQELNGVQGVFTNGYAKSAVKMEKAKSEQPYDQCNFHRPLTSYINPLLKKGFCLQEILEPVATTKELIESNKYWKLASEIPQVVILSFIYKS